MKNTDTEGKVAIDVRVAAIGAAAAIVTALFSTIVSNMPPQFPAAPTEAGIRSGMPHEVAIVPSRIEVFGVRSQDTAANDAQPPAAAPRS